MLLAFWLYNMEHIFCPVLLLCDLFLPWSGNSVVGTAFGKSQLAQEQNSNAQSKIFSMRNPRAVLCHQDVSWDVWQGHKAMVRAVVLSREKVRGPSYRDEFQACCFQDGFVGRGLSPSPETPLSSAPHPNPPLISA